ncbi:uncharacterized protein ARB_00155 [Trichophyton benhamiae CBS 112371]|uniref:Uncharacterized protein n=1 Tax=Arthroderma benhamiae (strain ATCC MYA-4681 / CBS 112371) TaxID=663331 RepID=D4AVE2_ARTBC|nr:uncharacterized protein ARB_00155 [Trichophyton benhamiae CBS 112371]EFE33064.1 hypothetical protein ARB_00155 [Trichophyton benhamiae CBS 112371]
MVNELMAGDWLIGGERDGEGVSGLNFSLPVEGGVGELGGAARAAVDAVGIAVVAVVAAGSAAAAAVEIEIGSGSKTARPQAGTGRDHLPFNEADETEDVCWRAVEGVAGVAGVAAAGVRTEKRAAWREFELAVFVSST